MAARGSPKPLVGVRVSGGMPIAGKHKVCRQPSKLRRVEFDSPYPLQFFNME